MARSNNQDSMLTASELAHLLNVHINTIRRWGNRGILKTYRVGPRGDRRFAKEDVDTFLAENLEGSHKPERIEQALVLTPR